MYKKRIHMLFPVFGPPLSCPTHTDAVIPLLILNTVNKVVRRCRWVCTVQWRHHKTFGLHTLKLSEKAIKYGFFSSSLFWLYSQLLYTSIKYFKMRIKAKRKLNPE